jgi:hypothetical protein
VLQERKYSQETTSRDLFIKALQTLPDFPYEPRHPCAIYTSELVWTQTDDELMKELLPRVESDPELTGWSYENIYTMRLVGKVMKADGRLAEKVNLRKLFCRQYSKKVTGKINTALYGKWDDFRKTPGAPDFDNQTKELMRKIVGTDMDVGHRQQKLFNWVRFCLHLLMRMHKGTKPGTIQHLLQGTLKVLTLPEATDKNIDDAILITLNKVLEKGSLTYVKASEVTKTNNPLFTLGGLFVDYCYSNEDVLNLEAIFNRLPVGVGDYDPMYIKPKEYKQPDFLPFPRAAVEAPTTRFLASLFFSCTVRIVGAVFENVERGLEKYYAEKEQTFPKAKYPSKRLNTIIYPAVCSSWLKVLLKTGTIIFPTRGLENVPGKRTSCRCPNTIRHFILVVLTKYSEPTSQFFNPFCQTYVTTYDSVRNNPVMAAILSQTFLFSQILSCTF